MFSAAFVQPFQPAFDRGGVAAVAGNGLLNNLVAYWPLNEAGGANNALDLHSNGLTLTQINSPSSAAGIVYAGARVIASNNMFTRASEALLNIGDNDFTVSLWLYPASFAALGVPIGKWFGQLSWLIDITTAGTVNVQLSSQGAGPTYDQTTTAALSLTAWQMLTLCYSYGSNSVTLYIDGASSSALGATQPVAAGVFSGTAPLNVGAYTTSTLPFLGRLGPIAFWKSTAGAGGVLDATKRTALWNAGAGLAYSAFTT